MSVIQRRVIKNWKCQTFCLILT